MQVFLLLEFFPSHGHNMNGRCLDLPVQHATNILLLADEGVVRAI